MTPEERRARGFRLAALLEDGDVRDLLNDIEKTFTDEWKAAQTAQERENCWQAVRVLGLLRQHMAAVASGEKDKVSAIRRAGVTSARG